MNRLASILLLLALCVPAFAGSIVTATITVTNTPADGDTITINGDARTWKTTVTATASQVVIGASIGANATNMFNQFARSPFTTLTLSRSGTNGVVLRGIIDQTISVSIAGTWGEYTLSTNTTTDAYQVQVPATSYATASSATNIISLLVDDIDTFSTNAFATGATALQNYADLTTAQTLSNKLIFGGTSTNSQFGMLNAWITNAYIYGALNVSNTSPAVYVYDTDAPADEKNTLISSANGDFTISTLNDAASSLEAIMTVSRTGWELDSITFGTQLSLEEGLTATGDIIANQITNTPVVNSTLTGNTYSGTIGSLTNGTIVGSTLTGVTVSGTVGTLSSGYLSGTGSTNMAATNATMSGTVDIAAATEFNRANHTSLANGANAAANFGDSTFIKIKAGPTAAFSIAGIANGADGRTYILYNATGQNMTISNDSGTDPTPANRIYTGTGADIATTANGVVTLTYDSEDSRWIVTSFRD